MAAVSGWSRPLAALPGYVAGVAVVLGFTLLAMLGASLLQTAAFVMAFPLVVLLVTARFGVGPALVTSLTGVLVFDYVFVPPVLAFGVPNLKDGLTLVILIVVAVVVAVLAGQLRKQAERARRQTEVERLRNSILGALSHDLRTPLTALVGAGQALVEDRLDARERRQFSRMVVDEAGRLHRLVVNLLELTRLESGLIQLQLEPQAIDEVIGTALYRLEASLHDRTIRTEVPEDVPLAWFDPVLVEQVLINLLENALRHTPRESPIEISVRGERDEILVQVADRGPGVPAGDEERVFERLYRSSGRGDGGIGLGLTICRAIVTAHEGRIWFENRPGGGAVVRLVLPVRRPETAKRRPLRALEHPLSAR
jgi:two-component system sensor histidine kinase KdpD